MFGRYFTSMYDEVKRMSEVEAERKQRLAIIDSVLERKRAPAKECINDLLGISMIDYFTASHDTHFNNSQHSHCHPYADTPINSLARDQLFIIITNYDNDRKRSQRYTTVQDDEIDFLMDELAYQALCLQLKFKSPNEDIVRLMHAISVSPYLSKNRTMKALEFFLNESFDDPTFTVRMSEKYNLDARHADFEAKMKLKSKLVPEIEEAGKEMIKAVNRFNASTPLIKHGFYAGKLPLLNREISETLDQIKTQQIDMIKGFDKLIIITKPHLPMQRMFTELRGKLVQENELSRDMRAPRI